LEAAVRKVLLAGIAFGALIAPAVAADMAVKAPYVAPYLWTGWYAGINAGYADIQSTVTNASTPTPDAALGVVAGVSEGLAALTSGKVQTGSGTDFAGGGQIGYNLQLNSFVVAGFEADIQGTAGSSSNGSVTTGTIVVGAPVTSTESAKVSTTWVSTVRGRLGLLVTPNWMVFATAGFAFGGNNVSASIAQTGTNGFAGAGSGSFSDTHWGGAFGGGLEWMFARGWSAKAEYVHYDLGVGNFTYSATSSTFATPVYQTVLTTAHFEGNLARLGLNYHF
jgi:outer membrane immunogenic protein